MYAWETLDFNHQTGNGDLWEPKLNKRLSSEVTYWDERFETFLSEGHMYLFGFSFQNLKKNAAFI